MSIIATDQFILQDLTYIPIGQHVPVLARPYVVNPTKQAIDTIADRMHETNSAKVTPTILSGVTDGLIQHSAVGFQSSINNDWVSTRRFIFILKVKTFDAIGSEYNSYIQGYTEYDGITANGNIDGAMVHHINNVIETVEFNIQTPMGIIRKEKLSRVYNVFAPQSNLDCFTQRPADVLENINIFNMTSIMGDGIQANAYSVNNFINPFNNKTVASVVDNNIATEYMSKILTTGLLVNKSRDILVGSYDVSETNSIDSRIPEPSLNDNRFIKYLSALSGFKVVREVFTFHQLMQLDNTIFNRFKLINLTKDYVNPLLNNTPEVGDYWIGQDPVTVKAHTLIESSVAMATKYGFNTLYFSATNMVNPTATPEVFITNFNSFINLDEQDFNYMLEMFRQKFITEIFLPETSNGMVPMHLEMFVDLLGTSKIHLCYSTFPENWYTIPTIANSLFSSVVTVNKNAFDETTYNVSQVIDAISTQKSLSRNYY